MLIDKVSMDDGRACAVLIKLISSGKWELSGDEAAALVSSKKWLHDLAMQMATILKSKPDAPKAPESTGMKVKAMGPLSSPSIKPRKKKK